MGELNFFDYFEDDGSSYVYAAKINKLIKNEKGNLWNEMGHQFWFATETERGLLNMAAKYSPVLCLCSDFHNKSSFTLELLPF